MQRKVDVVEDLDGKKIVFIHDIYFKEKHNKDAKFGWYRYESRFALPVFDESGEVERYNAFQKMRRYY